MKLFRPVDTSLFKSPPRVEILWALESLAWSDDYLVRTVDILARLARVESDDSYLKQSGKQPRSHILARGPSDIRIYQ